MTEVYKALTALGCQWLQLSSYRIKCKWRPNALRVAHPPFVPNSAAVSDVAATPGADGTTSIWGQPTAVLRGPSDSAIEMDVDSGVTGSTSGGKETASNRSNPGSHMDGNCMQVISEKEGEFVRIPNLSTAEYSIKIGLTLYKVQQNIYLLDFQKMTGDAFSFMTLCANIITELKTLSAASKQQQAQQLYNLQQQQQLHGVGGPALSPPGGDGQLPPPGP
jgi:hypothetical protein